MPCATHVFANESSFFYSKHFSLSFHSREAEGNKLIQIQYPGGKPTIHRRFVMASLPNPIPCNPASQKRKMFSKERGGTFSTSSSRGNIPRRRGGGESERREEEKATHNIIPSPFLSLSVSVKVLSLSSSLLSCLCVCRFEIKKKERKERVSVRGNKKVFSSATCWTFQIPEFKRKI